ncbi:MAG: PhzF family phenazine biosynthesis protein [Pseudomonadota bacterium]
MQITELMCFGARPGLGNPALVIGEGPASASARQDYARESRRTCVFVTPLPGGQLEADYYYPHTRSPLCLHASLAVGGLHGPLLLRTAMQGQQLRLSCTDGAVFVAVQQQAAATPAQLPDWPGLAPVSAPRVASVGSPKLLVEVADAATLHALQPPLAQLLAWGRAHGVNGCYVYCKVGEREYAGRNFNHLDPALEDSATGVAAGALSALLGHGLTLYQGRATGKDCRIVTRILGQDILVGGAVEVSIL